MLQPVRKPTGTIVNNKVNKRRLTPMLIRSNTDCACYIFNEKPCTGTGVPTEVLGNVIFQQNWPREYFWERGSGPGFRPRAGPRL